MSSASQLVVRDEGILASRAAYLRTDTVPEYPQASYYCARYYDSGPGRFLSEDPVGFLSGGLNFFEYVDNSPLGFTDPNGMTAEPSGQCCDRRKIIRGVKHLQQGFSGPNAARSKVYQKYKPCLDNLAANPDIRCSPPPKNSPTDCGFHSPLSPGAVFVTPNGNGGLGGCGAVKGTLAHEMVHSCIQSDFTRPQMSTIDEEKEAFGIECQLWGIGCVCARDPKKCGY